MNKTDITATNTKKSMKLPIHLAAGETEDQAVADALVRGTVCNAFAAVTFGERTLGELSLVECVKSIKRASANVNSGDLRPIEEMLFAQAVALQTLFSNLLHRSANQEYLQPFQAHLTLAMKAQAQCRATLEALAEIKNPRAVAFVKQANIAHGHQQVNNQSEHDSKVAASAPDSRAEKDANLRNRLLERQHGSCLDIGAESTAGGADSHLEAVGAVNRTAHP